VWNVVKETSDVTVVDMVISRLNVPQNDLHDAFDSQIGPIAARPFMEYMLFAIRAKYIDYCLLDYSVLNVRYSGRNLPFFFGIY